ncbi:MAG: hypothetical protein AMJ46_04670 [Latescibacteria bacterium DG_63]|nr:MAG: hypothetical protein AMJ46_04670 [Latescibacteria bacterium DG_63]
MKDSVVHVEKCDDYSEEKLSRALRMGLEAVGGLGELIKPGWRVLVKPNLLSARPPERAVTTHPSVVRGVVEEVMRCGAIPVVGDSPGGALKGVARVWRNTGMEEVCAKMRTPLLGFEVSGSLSLSVNGRSYSISKPVLDVDFIINLPKLKTHTLEVYTGAVKNMFGTVPGLAKAALHKLYPKPYEFAEVLLDVFALTKPDLNIMDGILSMEGPGPSSGRPRNLGVLLFSKDAVAMDVVACKIIGTEPMDVPTNKVAAARGLGVHDLDRIELSGVSLGEVYVSDYEIPSNFLHRLVPKGLLGLLRRHIWVHPRENADKCQLCNLCVESCPMEAISNVGKSLSFDYTRCTTCLCCHEVCPHDAIEFDMSWLARRIH